MAWTNVPIFDATPPKRRLTPRLLWDRITGKAERDAWEAGHKNGWRRGILESAAYCERYGARQELGGKPDIRRAALEVCAEHLRGVLPEYSGNS